MTATDIGAGAALQRYDRVARGFHWAIALLIVVNLLLGFLHDGLPGGPGLWIGLHKSLGLLVILLTLGRIGWRLSHRYPRVTAAHGWERALAHSVHGAFYALMLLVPLSGYVMSSAGKWGTAFFGLPMPRLPVPQDKAFGDIMHERHEQLGIILAVLLALHIAAALRHHFLLRDDTLRKMAG